MTMRTRDVRNAYNAAGEKVWGDWLRVGPLSGLYFSSPGLLRHTESLCSWSVICFSLCAWSCCMLHRSVMLRLRRPINTRLTRPNAPRAFHTWGEETKFLRMPTERRRYNVREQVDFCSRRGIRLLLCVAAARDLHVVETSLTCCAFMSFLESVPLAPSYDFNLYSNVPRMLSLAHHAPVPTRLCVRIDLLRPASAPPINFHSINMFKMLGSSLYCSPSGWPYLRNYVWLVVVEVWTDVRICCVFCRTVTLIVPVHIDTQLTRPA